MTSPAKPWELAAASSLPMKDHESLNGLNSSGPVPIVQLPPTQSRLRPANMGPPPLPPRGNRILRYQGLGLPQGMGSLGYSGGCGNFGGYGSPYSFNNYGYGMMPRRNDDFESRFIQLAEETSQPAFQSIEACVRSITSVSMMLESTYQAMYMSFRAVLGVADNMSRLRGIISQFLSSIAILKTIQWFYRKMLYWLGMRRENPLKEEIWKAAEAKTLGGGGVNSPVNSKSSWPVITFFGLILSGPYLMYKLIGSPGKSSDAENKWNPSVHGGQKVVAMFNFESSMPNELSFSTGDNILIAREPYARNQGGWVWAAKGNAQGFVPANRLGRPFVAVKEPQRPTQQEWTE